MVFATKGTYLPMLHILIQIHYNKCNTLLASSSTGKKKKKQRKMNVFHVKQFVLMSEKEAE